MSSLPIRIRLTLPFALAMSGVLVAMGVFVYFRVSNALLATINTNLHAQMSESEGHLRSGSKEILDQDTAAGPTVAQLLSANGIILQSTPAQRAPFLSKADRLKALDGHAVWRSGSLPGLKDDWQIG